jgi:hypothetical protein
LSIVLACNGPLQYEQKEEITKDVVDVVVEFWTNETKVNPNK